MGAPSRLEPEALTSAPDGDDGCLDLVLDREDLEALRVFHKSFNLPGLRFGLLNPICSDDYYPEDETAVPAVDREPWISQLPAQTESLITRANALLLGEEVPEEEVVEDVVDEGMEEEVGPASASWSRTVHSRSVRPHSGSHSRPTSGGIRREGGRR